MHFKDAQRLRARQVALLPNTIGVYALCDARGAVRYVGQTVDGIRTRVQRHTTSARSDVIANRLIDPGEIAYVRAYPVDDKHAVTPLEINLIHHFNDISPVMNGRIPRRELYVEGFAPPEPIEVPLMSAAMIAEKGDPCYLIQRQMKLQTELLDYIVHVKDNKDLRRSFKASLDIISLLTKELMH